MHEYDMFGHERERQRTFSLNVHLLSMKNLLGVIITSYLYAPIFLTLFFIETADYRCRALLPEFTIQVCER